MTNEKMHDENDPPKLDGEEGGAFINDPAGRLHGGRPVPSVAGYIRALDAERDAAVARADRVAKAAKEALYSVRELLADLARPSISYGYFPGGDYDPRKFTQDAELCTPEEIAAYKDACVAWDMGEQANIKLPMDGCIITNSDGHVVKMPCNSPLGIGSYELVDDDMVTLLAKVEAAILIIEGP